ncbi:MAG: hypothetical protein ABJE47_05735 [bacterium]
MADRDFSLTVSMKDGPLTAPRWVHYLIRILIGLLLAVPFMRLGWAPEFAWLPGTVAIVLIRRARIVWRGFLPVGFERWPFPLRFDDALLDFSLNMMLMPTAQFMYDPTFWEGVAAAVVSVILLAGFLDRYHEPAT